MGANESTPAQAGESNPPQQPPSQPVEQKAAVWEPAVWSVLQGWPGQNSAHVDDPMRHSEVWQKLRVTRQCPGGLSFDVLDPTSCKHLGETINDMNTAFIQQGLPNLLDSPAGLPLQDLPHWDHLSAAVTAATKDLVQSVSRTPIGPLTCVRAVAKRSTPKSVNSDWLTNVRVTISDWVMNRPKYTDATLVSQFRPQSLEAVQSEPGYIVATENSDYVLTVDLSGPMRGGDFLLAEKGCHAGAEERLYQSRRMMPFDTLLQMQNTPEGPIAIVPKELVPFIPAAPWFGKVLEDPTPVIIEYQQLTEAVNRQLFWTIQQRPGRGILHAGAQRYKNLPPLEGTRLSLVLCFDSISNLSRMSSLPAPLFERIFSFLSPADLAAVRRSSKTLRAHTFAPSIWRAQVQAEIRQHGGDHRSVYVNGAQIPLEWAADEQKGAQPDGEAQEHKSPVATPLPMEVAFAERALARKTAGGNIYAGARSPSHASASAPSSPKASANALAGQLAQLAV